MSKLDLVDHHIPVPESIHRIADSADRHLAWHFFVFFSRFEYALKRDVRYLKSGVDHAVPYWDGFAADYNEVFQSTMSPPLVTAVEYFKLHPPRQQLRSNLGMDWSEPSIYDGKEILLKWVLCMVRRVRNNLFHGGKFPLIPMPDPSRDRELLINAMVILNACLALDTKIMRLFEEGLDE